MNIQEHVSLKSKTTMRIGGTARYYVELSTKGDVETAAAFARENRVPLFVLGGGSNTIFADGEVEVLVVRIKADRVEVKGNLVRVEAGKILAVLMNELAKQGLDLSALTGIPGTVGGAIYGNSGQGPKGVWIDSYVESVEVFENGAWETLKRDNCRFRYRESLFKDPSRTPNPISPIIWSAALTVPWRSMEEIEAEVGRLLKRRIEHQPHRQTAGSCFKAVGGAPAWRFIDAVGLRGHTVGGIQISEKHANFLLNLGDATFEDARKIVEDVKSAVKEPLEVEMRFIRKDGTTEF